MVNQTQYTIINIINAKHFKNGIIYITMNTLKNNIFTDKYATQGIINGINKIADAVALTMGAKGSNAILETNLYPGYMITNDGYSILEKAQFEDPLEELGRKILFDSVSRANKQSGDGSTTTTVLTQSILNAGLQYDVSSTEIKDSLIELLPTIDKLIDEQKKDITENDVSSVATISAESKEIGDLLQEIYQKISKDGIIELDNSKTFETTYEIKEGVRFNCGSHSPYLYNKDNHAEYTKPYILITKQKIATLDDIIPIFEKLSELGKKEIVIFYDDISDAVAGTLIANHLKGIFNVLLIKAPVIWKDFIFEDFAKITGATIISEKTGTSLKEMEIKDLGTCNKLIATKAETTILGIKDVSDHIKALQESGTDDDARRIGWLTTKAAVIRLGASSDTELSYKRLKVEDAIHASRLALQDGIVVGGGVALLNVSKSLPDTLGGKILKEALKRPMQQICANANIFLENTVLSDSKGVNAKTGEVVDMFEAQIVDPAKVVKNAVRNAISVASTALTIKIAIPLDRTEEQIAMNFINKQKQW